MVRVDEEVTEILKKIDMMDTTRITKSELIGIMSTEPKKQEKILNRLFEEHVLIKTSTPDTYIVNQHGLLKFLLHQLMLQVNCAKMILNINNKYYNITPKLMSILLYIRECGEISWAKGMLISDALGYKGRGEVLRRLVDNGILEYDGERLSVSEIGERVIKEYVNRCNMLRS